MAALSAPATAALHGRGRYRWRASSTSGPNTQRTPLCLRSSVSSGPSLAGMRRYQPEGLPEQESIRLDRRRRGARRRPLRSREVDQGRPGADRRGPLQIFLAGLARHAGKDRRQAGPAPRRADFRWLHQHPQHAGAPIEQRASRSRARPRAPSAAASVSHRNRTPTWQLVP